MRSPKLAALELKRFGRGRMPRAALVALLLLPLLYGALYLCSFWDPYGRLDKIPAALVNTDRGATAKGGDGKAEKVTAGEDLASGLLDSKTFDWHEVSPAEARKGIEDGTYYLSLTVPSDFSRRIASSSGGSPETGALRVRTNDANNYIVGQISRSVFAEVRSAASTRTSRTFLDKIFVSFSDIHGKTEEAAKGADDLNGGIGKAKRGVSELANGLGDARDGSRALKEGVEDLHAGARDLQDGSRQVADGVQTLADRVDSAADKAGPVLKDHGRQIGESARHVAEAGRKLKRSLGDLLNRSAKSAKDLRQGADRLAALYAGHCESGAEVEALLDCSQAKEVVDAADTAADTAEDFDGLVQDHRGTDELGAHLDELNRLSLELADRAPTLGSDLDAAVAKVDALSEGARAVAKGAQDLQDGLARAQQGSAALDSGIGRLAGGADDLSGGMFRLADGSGKLAGGLHEGAAKIPDYDEKDRDARTEVMADPVRLASQSMHKAPNYGTGFAPYFIPLSLWVGSMVAYMIIQPLNRRALAAGSSSWRVALAGWLPVAALGVLQTAALMAVLHWGLGLEMARAGGTLGFLALTTACFAAVVQWLNARFGPAGRILVLALLMLQLTSAGGTYPVQTSPAFFNAIHPFLPMTYVVEGLRRLITGGDLVPVWQGCAVLGAYTLGALALTAWSARRKQVWTLDRLHPELSL
ncbi:YhgE/Pip family protein [Streptomyces pathocidini]|uniref:YhgE/Pip family protein n=1 Tax=Streptomyces pathocidini TaxID=1650571 RepID=A0ABW7UVQ7_9ACTN|nr:YhgE/Pip domain-containing protein [Streptomyces pathocidini]